MTKSETRRNFLGKLAVAAAGLTLGRGFTEASAAAAAKPWTSGMALDITFTVATKAAGRVKRPFVAVWIEDANGKTVRNLTAWVSQSRLNPRWLAELRRWTRDNGDLVDTVSSATRNPGTYAISWDGKTDKGTLAPQGDYYVCIEAAREHGPYSLIREKVSVGSSSFTKALTPNNDLEAASLNFKKA